MTSTPTESAAPTMGEACHSMLLRLAGQVPDELLTRSREWLAAREPEKLAQAIASYAGAARLAMPEQDAALLRWILEATGLDPTALDRIDQIETTPSAEGAPLQHAFAPASPDVMARRAHEFGPCLDLIHGLESDLADDLDRACAASVAGVPGTVALWRAWRTPADGSPWPAPRRVFLLAVGDPADSWQAAAVLQDQLARHGERDPQVEAFGLAEPLPAYQRAARAMSALLWTSTDHEPLRLAAVYDEGPEDTPALAADRPRLTDLDRAVVADLLAGGTLVLSTTALLDDILDPARQRRVPMNFRTDGAWVWSDAIGYYVREHGIAPVAPLLEHLRSGPPRDPDAVALFRATAALTRPES
jgi:hypothetical protein